MKPRVVIVVEGGVVQSVLTDKPISVLIRDFDEDDAGADGLGLINAELDSACVQSYFEDFARNGE